MTVSPLTRKKNATFCDPFRTPILDDAEITDTPHSPADANAARGRAAKKAFNLDSVVGAPGD